MIAEKTRVPKKVHIGKFFALPNGDYYPFGKEARSSVSVNKPRENFTGHQLDGESALIYAGARYYNQDIGRWTSVDPNDEKYPDWSPYNYSSNNPINFLDPDGKDPKWFIRTVKGVWKRVTRDRAVKETENLGDVLAEGRGSSKAAKKLRKDAHVDKKIKRDDADKNVPDGLPHYQNKTGKKGHTFYKPAAAGAAAGEAGESTSEASSESSSKAGEVVEAVAEVVSDFLNDLMTFGLSDPEHNRAAGFGNQGEDVDGDGEDDASDEIDNRPKEEKQQLETKQDEKKN